MSGSLIVAAGARIDTGDTAWMLVATALVLMMTPALGLFYAGLVRAKNTLNTFMMSVGALGVVTVAWAVLGYSLAFSKGNGFIGGFGYLALHGVTFTPRAGTTIPHLLFMTFEAAFCIITAALVSGAVVERMRFGPFLIFMLLWSVLVYPVLAHWVWGGGWLVRHGALDFAGVVPVEVASGFSGFAAALGLREDLPPWRRIWHELTRLIQDDEQNHNNRFVVADALNRCCGGDTPGPFWGHPVGRTFPSLQPTSPGYPYLTGAAIALPRLRAVDAQERGLQPVWKLYGPASVGGQTFLGIPAIARLLDDLALVPISRVWPFETGLTPEPTATSGPQVIHAEIWPGIVPTLDPDIPIREQAQFRAMIAWLMARDDAGTLGECFAPPARVSAASLQNCLAEEGWIVGAGLTR